MDYFQTATTASSAPPAAATRDDGDDDDISRRGDEKSVVTASRNSGSTPSTDNVQRNGTPGQSAHSSRQPLDALKLDGSAQPSSPKEHPHVKQSFQQQQHQQQQHHSSVSDSGFRAAVMKRKGSSPLAHFNAVNATTGGSAGREQSHPFTREEEKEQHLHTSPPSHYSTAYRSHDTQPATGVTSGSERKQSSEETPRPLQPARHDSSSNASTHRQTVHAKSSPSSSPSKTSRPSMQAHTSHTSSGAASAYSSSSSVTTVTSAHAQGSSKSHTSNSSSASPLSPRIKPSASASPGPHSGGARSSPASAARPAGESSPAVAATTQLDSGASRAEEQADTKERSHMVHQHAGPHSPKPSSSSPVHTPPAASKSITAAMAALQQKRQHDYAARSAAPESTIAHQGDRTSQASTSASTSVNGNSTNTTSHGSSNSAGGGGGLASKMKLQLPAGACCGSSTSLTGRTAAVAGKLFGSATAGLARKGAPQSVQNPRFKALSGPDELARVVAEHAEHRTLLVLDLRPHTAFTSQGRLVHSVNVCVPSTLLRRPNFGLPKIQEAICSRKDWHHFARVLGLSSADSGAASSSLEHKSKDKGQDGASHSPTVMVLDQDTVMLSADSTVHSIMSKIEKSDFTGNIHWVKGGWNGIHGQAVKDGHVTHPGLSSYLDLGVFTEEEEEEVEEAGEASDVAESEGTDAASTTNSVAIMSSSDSQVSDTQDSKTPRQPFPGANAAAGGMGGAYFESLLAAAESRGVTGRSSQSSFASTTSSDSLLPSSVASSHSSTSSASAGSSGQFSAGSPLSMSFDPSKLSLPSKRPSTSPGTRSPSKDGGAPAHSGSLPIKGRPPHLSSANSKPRSSSAGGSIIRPKNLPMTAFQLNSTAQGNAQSSISPLKTLSGNKAHATGGTHSKQETQVTGKPNGSARRQAANPFFDNIRQNIESASLDTVLQHVAPFEIPEELTRKPVLQHLPSFLTKLISLSPKARAEKLHKEYFEIEQAEQKRLQKVLDWHCQQSQVIDITSKDETKEAQAGKATDDGSNEADNEQYHPFSISAGVEKGHLNRYKNMWPYEHARVRLGAHASPSCGDYINASHIRLRGTSKRYIASQGPLEQTTEHFWRLVMQENVHVIVMLTLLQEGGREKCSNYFQTAEYNDISVALKEEKGSVEAMKKSVCHDFGFFADAEPSNAVQSPQPLSDAAYRGDHGSKEPFYSSTQAQASNSVIREQYVAQTPSGLSKFKGHKRSTSRRLDSAIVRRTIELRRKSDPPSQPPKVVKHIQYIKWPDFDIPPDPNVVLDLVTETSRAQQSLVTPGEEEAPVLVHCSAGVGRTGTFIAVDTLLERYRNERKARSPSSPRSSTFQRPHTRRSGSHSAGSLDMQGLSLSDARGADSSESANRPPVLRSYSSDDSPRVLADRLGITQLLPEDISDPIPSLVNQMREQRMSSVANAGQYVFTYLALLAGITQDLIEEGAVSPTPA